MPIRHVSYSTHLFLLCYSKEGFYVCLKTCHTIGPIFGEPRGLAGWSIAECVDASELSFVASSRMASLRAPELTLCGCVQRLPRGGGV